MKKIKMYYMLSVVLSIVILFCGCGKQKQCDAGCDGYLIYLENPKKEITGFFLPDRPNLNIDSVCNILIHEGFYEYGPVYPIIGNIPREFKTNPNKPVRAHCTLENFVHYHDGIEPSKIICIYKI